MSTTLAPSLGHGALMTQQGTGTTPGFDAIDVRRMTNGDLQEGVLNASDFMVVQRAAGANMSVDIGMPAGGAAYVQGDTVSGQGLYTVPVHSATINETITAANATNPRVDQIILEVLDNVHDASGSNLARTRVLTGTATAGATLANRTGAALLPGNALLLADVLVGASVSSIANNVIRDRRKFARGAYTRIVRNANAAAGNDYTTTTTASAVALDDTNLRPRVECSGVPVRMTLRGRILNTVATDGVGFNVRVDSGFGVDGDDGTGVVLSMISSVASADASIAVTWDWVPAAGSHLLTFWWRALGAGTATIFARSTVPLVLTVEELVRQNTANNSVTTG